MLTTEPSRPPSDAQAVEVPENRTTSLPSRPSTITEVFRYVGAGGINTLFGVSMFLILVRFGFNQYLAQIVSHVIGSAFNYYTYRVHVFRGSSSKFWRFVASYIGNYFVSLGVLVLVSRFIAPAYPASLLQFIARSGGGTAQKATSYCSGLISVTTTAFLNYFVLKRFVFQRK